MVCHGGVLNCMRQHALKTDLSVASSNASLNRFLLRRGEDAGTGETWSWLLESWNEVAHLREIGTSAVGCITAPAREEGGEETAPRRVNVESRMPAIGEGLEEPGQDDPDLMTAGIRPEDPPES